jgi:hypothetical protein
LAAEEWGSPRGESREGQGNCQGLRLKAGSRAITACRLPVRRAV